MNRALALEFDQVANWYEEFGLKTIHDVAGAEASPLLGTCN